MSVYIQIGTSALRDPVTGQFTPEIPLYVNKHDLAEHPAHGVNLASVAFNLAAKMREYRQKCRKEGLK